MRRVMRGLTVQFLGSGDAFGSGGRFQACFLLRTGGDLALVDCGSSTLIAMKNAGLDPSEVGWIFISHLHGDHFGGIPFFVLDGQFRRRERPLIVAGPPGIQNRVEAAMEILFPGSRDVQRRFAVEYVELAERVSTSVGPVVVTPYAAVHASGAPAFALRLEVSEKIVAYSGDTEWTDDLFEVARGADLFICEVYFFEKKIRYHLDYRTLEANRDRLDCKRIVMTHMSEDMLTREGEAVFEAANDAMLLTL
jgi:ribonuclease BN (tRNA processing enzyme)